MENLNAQIAELQRCLQDRDDEIARMQLESQGAAHAIQAAQAEQITAAQAAAARAERIVQLEREIRAARGAPAGGVNSNNNETTPAETVLRSLQTPTTIRDLPTFDGNPIKLNQFLKTVDNIMPTLELARGSQSFNVWIQSIRSKIIGDADTVLELYGTDLSWSEIKQNLITHYNDKRDEVSLTRDLFKLSQSGSYETFYAEVSHIIALLVNKLNLAENNANVKMAKNRFYQEMGLKVFVAGLKEPLGPIIRAQAPETLREALRLCAEENNYNYVKNPFKTQPPSIPPRSTFHTPRPTYHPPPRFPSTNPFNQPKSPMNPFAYNFNQNPFPKQPFVNNFNQNTFPKQPFVNHNPFKPQPLNPNFPRQQPYPPRFNPNPFRTPNAFAPRPAVFQKPVPMEVDPSIRSRKINYMNRPHFHEEEGPENYYTYDPYEYHHQYSDQYHHDYYDCPPEQYSEEQDNFTESCNSTKPSLENGADQTKEDVQVDDLNFHMVSGARGGT